MYSFSKRMRVGHDFLTHFTQCSKFDNTNDAESCVSRNQVQHLEML
jgi:hypothetical protein